MIKRLLEILTTRNNQLERIAAALERIAPLPEEPVELKPEDAVSYVDEEKIAKAELAEEMGEIDRYMRAQEELAERDDGGIDVLSSRDRS